MYADSFQLDGIDIKDASEATVEKIKEECCPGNPFIVYRTEVDYILHLILMGALQY